MTGFACRFSLAVVCALTWCTLMSTAPASADSAAAVASQWELLGSWALDCSLMPDRDRGARLTYRLADDGRLVHDRDFGDISDSHDVRDAEMMPDGSLRLTVDFPEIRQTREYRLMKDPDGGLRTISNRGNGRYSIRNGRFTASGKPVPTQVRCD